MSDRFGWCSTCGRTPMADGLGMEYVEGSGCIGRSHDVGPAIRIDKIDYEAAISYLHATIWSIRNNWKADRSMPNKDELQYWVERIIALIIEGGDE